MDQALRATRHTDGELARELQPNLLLLNANTNGVSNRGSIKDFADADGSNPVVFLSQSKAC